MPLPDEYLTITRAGNSEVRRRGSRFLGFAMQVRSAEEADRRRQALRKKYHDATHQPFAYRLSCETERSCDDGEPPGTSGASILQQIVKRDLYDVQVVVVRYFGGAKLGRGNLSRAFGECAQRAIEGAKIAKRSVTNILSLSLDPQDVNSVLSAAAKFNAVERTRFYDERAHLRLAVPQSNYLPCLKALRERWGPHVFDGEG